MLLYSLLLCVSEPKVLLTKIYEGGGFKNLNQLNGHIKVLDYPRLFLFQILVDQNAFGQNHQDLVSVNLVIQIYLRPPYLHCELQLLPFPLPDLLLK